MPMLIGVKKVLSMETKKGPLEVSVQEWDDGYQFVVEVGGNRYNTCAEFIADYIMKSFQDLKVLRMPDPPEEGPMFERRK